MWNIFNKKKRIKAKILGSDFFNQEIMTNKKTALITFSAAWCGACKMQRPLIHDIADAHHDKDIIVGFIDTDNETVISQSFQIQGIPTTIGFKNSEIVFRKSGLLSRRNLEEIITELITTSE